MAHKQDRYVVRYYDRYIAPSRIDCDMPLVSNPALAFVYTYRGVAEGLVIALNRRAGRKVAELVALEDAKIIAE